MSLSQSKVLLIGGSAGSLPVIKNIVNAVLTDNMVTIIVIHLPEDSAVMSVLSDKEAIVINDKTEIVKGNVYMAPGGYHSYIESDNSFSLSLDEKVNYCRPAIDVLFYSAAEVYKQRCVAVILSGANNDGALGLKRIADCGGHTLIQDPNESAVAEMPLAAMKTLETNIVLNHKEIIAKINGLLMAQMSELNGRIK